jgi:N-methylhydantoinase B
MTDESLDGATVEVIRATFAAAAEEMRTALIRAAFSPVIYEVRDFGISIYNADCELVAEAPGLTRFLGANDYAVVKVVERFGAARMKPGDVIVSNYPYWNGAHTYDVTLVAPVFAPARTLPVAFLCIRVHWIDLGAKDPGYVVDSVDMHQEGLILPVVRLVKEGVLDKTLVDIIRFNSRFPDRLMGDVNAQLSAVATGRRRLAAAIAQFGIGRIETALRRVLDHGERTARRALAELPEGSWQAEDWLDDDGISDQPVRIAVTVTHRDGVFTTDFAGTAPATRGPINLPFGSTQASAKVAFKALTTPFEPANAGHMRPLRVKAEPGTLFHAVYPAATFTQWAGMAVIELVFKALRDAMPDRIQASSGGDVPGFMVVGRHPDTGQLYTVSNNDAVGWGATARHDGRSAGSHLAQSIVRNTPVEVFESRGAVRVDQLELREGSGGRGTYRGGDGIRRSLTFTGDGEFLSITKRSRSAPWSLAGGGPGEASRFVLFAGTAKERTVGTSRVKVAAGDKVIVLSGGGGGYGPGGSSGQ